MVCKSQGIVNKKVSKICLMWESRTDVSLQIPTTTQRENEQIVRKSSRDRFKLPGNKARELKVTSEHRF